MTWMKLTEGDGGKEAAGAGTLFAVAEEEVGTAGSAEVANEDVFFAEASSEELGAVGFAEVEADVFGRRLVAGRHHIEPLERIGLFAAARFIEPFGGVSELRGELGEKLGADFVAAWSDGRTEGRKEAGWI